MKKTIYFLRHGETEFNKMHIVQGSGVNSDLNETGLEQGNAFYEMYKHMDFELVITSALKRTHQSVKGFIEAGTPWIQMTELNEMSWGIHEGKKGGTEMRESYLELVGQWNNGNYEARIEGGESAKELDARVRKFFEFLKSRKEQRILVCTHGRTMTCINCYMEERPLKDMNLFKHYNTALTKTVLENDKFQVEITNDISHLQPN